MNNVIQLGYPSPTVDHQELQLVGIAACVREIVFAFALKTLLADSCRSSPYIQQESSRHDYPASPFSPGCVRVRMCQFGQACPARRPWEAHGVYQSIGSKIISVLRSGSTTGGGKGPGHVRVGG